MPCTRDSSIELSLWRGTSRHFPLDILPEARYSSPRMSTIEQRERIELLQGTSDLLILRTLLLGPRHGHRIARAIEMRSEDVFQVEQGSLYPALHRLIKRDGFPSRTAPRRTIAGPSSTV